MNATVAMILLRHSLGFLPALRTGFPIVNEIETLNKARSRKKKDSKIRKLTFYLLNAVLVG